MEYIPQLSIFVAVAVMCVLMWRGERRDVDREMRDNYAERWKDEAEK